MTAPKEYGVFLPVAMRSARARSPKNSVGDMTAPKEYGVFLPVAMRSARERVRQKIALAT
jgi:hypothetical protein